MYQDLGYISFENTPAATTIFSQVVERHPGIQRLMASRQTSVPNISPVPEAVSEAVPEANQRLRHSDTMRRHANDTNERCPSHWAAMYPAGDRAVCTCTRLPGGAGMASTASARVEHVRGAGVGGSNDGCASDIARNLNGGTRTAGDIDESTPRRSEYRTLRQMHSAAKVWEKPVGHFEYWDWGSDSGEDGGESGGDEGMGRGTRGDDEELRRNEGQSGDYGPGRQMIGQSVVSPSTTPATQTRTQTQTQAQTQTQYYPHHHRSTATSPRSFRTPHTRPRPRTPPSVPRQTQTALPSDSTHADATLPPHWSSMPGDDDGEAWCSTTGAGHCSGGEGEGDESFHEQEDLYDNDDDDDDEDEDGLEQTLSNLHTTPPQWPPAFPSPQTQRRSAIWDTSSLERALSRGSPPESRGGELDIRYLHLHLHPHLHPHPHTTCSRSMCSCGFTGRMRGGGHAGLGRPAEREGESETETKMEIVRD